MRKGGRRLTHVDCMRGIACILMFQTHAYDSWLNPLARSGKFFEWSQFASTLVAPSFLFLVGISLSLAMDGMSSRGAPRGEIARTTIRRGAKIFALALLFRGQEFILGLRYAPWTDLLRVDILNIIGVSIAIIGFSCWAVRDRAARGVVAAVAALSIAMITPLLWTSWRPQGLPWFLETYVNGVHTFAKPVPWLFPIFPWTGFCFAGLAAGSWLGSEWVRRREGLAMALAAAGGIALLGFSWFLDALPVQIYREYDFWHTSPNFFFARVGVLLIILASCYWWSRHGAEHWDFTRLVQLGQSSLLVYWIHIEFVYGRFSILPKRGVGILTASAGLLVIIASMLILSASRVWLLGQGRDWVNWFRRKARPAG